MQMWADIPGFTGYQASESGDIRNKHGRVMQDRRAINGARRINLGKATRMVHALVASAFLTHRPVDSVIRWRNGDKRDNRLANLYYGGRGRESAEPVGARCSKGHSLASAGHWGTKNRLCAECAAGKPRIIELPERI